MHITMLQTLLKRVDILQAVLVCTGLLLNITTIHKERQELIAAASITSFVSLLEPILNKVPDRHLDDLG